MPQGLFHNESLMLYAFQSLEIYAGLFPHKKISFTAFLSNLIDYGLKFTRIKAIHQHKEWRQVTVIKKSATVSE